jgi:hypothetical protein
MNYRSTSIGTGGSNWLRTTIPDVVEVGVAPLAVVVGTDKAPGGLAGPCVAGTVAGGLAIVDGVAVWLEQAAFSPNKIARAAFFMKRLLPFMFNR